MVQDFIFSPEECVSTKKKTLPHTISTCVLHGLCSLLPDVSEFMQTRVTPAASACMCTFLGKETYGISQCAVEMRALEIAPAQPFVHVSDSFFLEAGA